MEDKDLIQYIEDIKTIMTDVATWKTDILKIDDRYKTIYVYIAKELKRRNIKNNNEYFSLWDFYNFRKDNWLSTYQSRRNHIRELYKHIEYNIIVNGNELLEEVNASMEDTYQYFSTERINEIRDISCVFDMSKVVKVLEEINICYKYSCYLWVSCLLRMLLDHIPPIFGKKNFNEVVNNFAFSKSDQKSMAHLLWWLINIADWNLHNQISQKEVIATKQSVEFRADFDILLKNIILQLNQ